MGSYDTALFRQQLEKVKRKKGYIGEDDIFDAVKAAIPDVDDTKLADDIVPGLCIALINEGWEIREYGPNN